MGLSYKTFVHDTLGIYFYFITNKLLKLQFLYLSRIDVFSTYNLFLIPKKFLNQTLALVQAIKKTTRNLIF